MGPLFLVPRQRALYYPEKIPEQGIFIPLGFFPPKKGYQTAEVTPKFW